LSELDAYDSLLIEEAHDLCRTFNLTPKVRRLFWIDRMFWSKVNSDECSFGTKMKKRRLEADVEVAKVLGRDQFLKVLSKIEGLGLDDVVRRTEKRGIGRHFSGKPSIPERIANLSAKT